MSEAMATSAAAGWSLHPSMTDTRRYWDGGGWTDHIAPANMSRRVARPESPAAWVFCGVLSSVVAGGIGGLAANVMDGNPGLGWLFLGVAILIGTVGSVLLVAGTIAIGLRLGARCVE